MTQSCMTCAAQITPLVVGGLKIGANLDKQYHYNILQWLTNCPATP